MLPLISASNGNIIVSRLVFSLAIFAVLARRVGENVKQESADAVGLDRPNDPKHKEDRGHCCGHVEVGIPAAQQRSIDMENAGRWIMMSPADRANTRDETEPVYK